MRFTLAALALLLLAGCFPRGSAKPPVVRTPQAPAPAHHEAPPPLAPLEAPQVTVRTVSGITFNGIAFDSRKHRLVVVDQARGPGSEFADSAAAARSIGGIAAINAGFFTPDGRPLGGVVSSGKPAGSWNQSSSLGSGAWFETTAGNSALARRGRIVRGKNLRELIQAGPLLIESGSGVGGLEATKVSARSLILWDGGSRWWIGRSSPCSLAALGQSLAIGPPAGWPVEYALNLDGGRSSDLWISDRVAGGPVLIRPPWNRPVRNFLVLVAR